MHQGISETEDLLDELEKICVLGILLAKTGVGFGSAFKVLDLIKAAAELIKDAPLAAVELADLDAEESARLSTRALAMTKKIIDAVRS